MGSTDLTFTSATRCTLVVRADSAETRLPSEWRLLWVADSLSIQFVVMDSLEACLLDAAQVSRIDAPATAADSAANQITAHFCSETGEATMALQVMDLPAGGHGKLKAVALDPSDQSSSRVIESNDATYNGGIVGQYAPVVLGASSVHQSLQLRVTAVGSGLNGVNSMSIMAPDSTWTMPLTVTSQTDASVTGVASVAALLPECQATVGSAIGAVSAATLAADEEPASESPQSCQAQYHENYLAPPPGLGFAIQPKDFAFVRGFVDDFSDRFALHLFYIRRSYYNIPADSNEKRLGHTSTTDFNSWAPADTSFFEVRQGMFDALHVWAPTIVQRGPTFHMFYTGVRSDVPSGPQHQRIGLATSTDLNIWTRSASHPPVLACDRIPADQLDGVFGGVRRQRDLDRHQGDLRDVQP